MCVRPISHLHQDNTQIVAQLRPTWKDFRYRLLEPIWRIDNDAYQKYSEPVKCKQIKLYTASIEDYVRRSQIVEHWCINVMSLFTIVNYPHRLQQEKESFFASYTW